MKRPFHKPLSEAFICRILSLLQNIDPNFRNTVIPKKMTMRRNSPEMLKNKFGEKLYCERRVLVEYEPEGLTINLTILKKSSFELKML